MKNILTKITLFAIALVAAFGVMANGASAAGYFTTPTSLNQHNADCPTVMIANHTTQAGVGPDCWATSIPTVQPGQIINVMVYYHNTGYSTAHDVRVRLNNPSGSATSFSFNAGVSDSEGDSASGSVSMNISSSQTLQFGSVKWYPEQATSPRSLPNGQSGTEIFSGGLSLGNLSPDTVGGYTNQGTVVVSFKVSESNTPNGNLPTVATNNYSNRNHELGNVTLNGYYNSNSSTTDTWFEYRKNGGSWTTVGTQGHGSNDSGNISKSLSDLASGDYEYRAVAENQYGRVEGIIISFNIDRGDDSCDGCECDNDCDNNDDISVETKSAEDIEEDEALLVGDLNDVGSGNTERWFEWDTRKSDVEDGDGETLKLSGDTDNDGEFSKRLTDLDSDETYYFRACAEDDDGNRDCGAVKSFTTDDDNGPSNNTDLPDITTLSALYIGASSATVDGFYDANGCSVTTHYEYGRTSSLGSNTPSMNRGDNSGSMAYTFTQLVSNTTYYYRAVGTNCEGTTRGSVKNFTTTGDTIIVDHPPVVVSTGGGSGNSFIKLMIDNHRETVRGGTEIGYDVSWENITTRKLTDLVLEINFPEQMTVIDTDRGEITRDGHSVIYEISELTSRASGELTVTTEVVRGLRDGDPVVAQAIMAFENPTTQATENAIAYDSDEFSTRDGSVLGASLFGLGFLPGSLAGWLLILLILLIIIVLARHFMAQNQNKVTVNTAPQNPPAPNTGTNDYIVYHPNPLNK